MRRWASCSRSLLALQESGDGAGALAEWKKALELSPRNMWLRRKIEAMERGS